MMSKCYHFAGLPAYDRIGYHAGGQLFLCYDATH